MCPPESGLATPHGFYTALLSHELRTPVTAILRYLQLLEDEGLLNDPETLRQYLALTRGRAAELARLVSELATFSDLMVPRDASSGPPAGTQLPHLVVALAGRQPVRIEVTAEAAAAPVDEDRLRLILQQLLDNAWQHGTSGAEVLVRAEMTDAPPRLVVRVSNQGTPIPDAFRAAIFEPFRRPADPTTQERGGLGLGLTVARRAAEGIGGSLDLEPGPRTTFRVELPLRDDPIARQARALRERAAQADAQALRAIQDLRALRSVAAADRVAREMAEAQQLRAVQDFRTAHRQALQLAERLDRAYVETITALAKAVEARDRYTGVHVERVRHYSLWIAEALGLSTDELRRLEFGAILHDVGKIGVPDAILEKPGPLDLEEWTVMKQHPDIGRQVLEGIAFLAPALEAVSAHHERWDGTGYPNGLAGDAIPLAGRIVAVADAFDAMTSDRPYRKALPREVALDEIARGRGTQFDPDIAQAFLDYPPEPV